MRIMENSEFLGDSDDVRSSGGDGADGANVRGSGDGGSGDGWSGNGVGGNGGDEDDQEIVTDTEQLVQEALGLVPTGVEVPVDFRSSDIDEECVVEDFMQAGCGGKEAHAQKCLYVKASRLIFSELTIGFGDNGAAVGQLQ